MFLLNKVVTVREKEREKERRERREERKEREETNLLDR